jgi:MinD-like ATPase involved in chromosome partitioning or flagellar assembly
MKLLIVDISAEAQALVAKRIDMFSQSDKEMLDLKVGLVGENDFLSRVQDADVVIIGSGLQEQAVAMSRQASSIVPWIHIIMFVTDTAYGGGAFRAAHSAGVRKVFTDSAGPLDVLQELVGIYAEFRREGRTREGRVVVVTHAKGGVGATSITAALGEVCSVFNRRTLLWDLDVESRDLSRSLSVNGVEARVVSSWVNGSRDISKDSLMDALVQISNEVSVLMPPDKMAESMDLICHTDGIQIVQRITELSRVLFDIVLIDTGGRLGPATGALIRAADVVLVVIDDTLLGLTAVDLYLKDLKTLAGGTDRVVFAVNPYSGSMMGISQIAAELEPAHSLGEAAWRLPAISNDPNAQMWPGSGRTLYSMGQRSTATTFEKIAKELSLVDHAGVRENVNQSRPTNYKQNSNTSWFSKLLGKKSDNDSFTA